MANLVTNPGFEVDAADWFGLSAPTISRTTAEQHGGTASLKVVCDGSASFEGAMTEITEGFTIGERYTFSVWIKGEAGSHLRLRVEDAAGTTHKPFTPAGGWQKVSFNHVVAEGTTELYVGVLVNGTQATTFYLDDANFDLPVLEDFNGDFEPGDFSQYLETQAPEGRAAVVKSPVGEGEFAALFEVLDGDPEVAGGHRSEAIPDREFFDGDEAHVRDLINLQEVDWDHWSIPFQFHDTSEGSPPLCGLLRRVDGEKRLRICSGDQKAIFLDLDVPEGRYFEIVLHVVFGAKGSVEVWINGVSQGKATEANTIGNEPTNLKVGVYRSQESVGRTAILHDGLLITSEFFSEPPAPELGVKALKVDVGGDLKLCPVRGGM